MPTHPAPTPEPARIRAREGCTCRAPWFDCHCDVTDTIYTATGAPWAYVDCVVAPTPAFIDYVRSLHPDAILIHI